MSSDNPEALWFTYLVGTNNLIVEPLETNQVPENYIYFTAKYAGETGNQLRLNISAGDIGTYYVKVYREIGDVKEIIEVITYNFVDPLSPNYWETVNFDTEYVEAKLVGKYTGTSDNPWVYPTDTDRDVNNPDYIALEGGTDGEDTDEATVYEQVVNIISNNTKLISTGAGLFDDIKDPLMYAVDVITDGGFNNTTADSINFNDYSVDAVLTQIAKVRGDSIYLVDGNSEWSYKQYFDYCANFGAYSNVAAFGPWGYGTLLYNGVTALIPGSYILLISWGSAVSDGAQKWLSPAGLKRSYINSFLKFPKYRVNNTILDTWQSKDYVIGSEVYKINPIMNIRGNYCIYGNSTTLHNRADGSTSMLQAFNVRVLVNMIRMYAIEISARLQFDQLSDTLFQEFKSLMSVPMDSFRHDGALFDYKIETKNAETLTLADRNSKTLPVKISISPNAACENIDITLEINQSGVSFSDVVE